MHFFLLFTVPQPTFRGPDPSTGQFAKFNHVFCLHEHSPEFLPTKFMRFSRSSSRGAASLLRPSIPGMSLTFTCACDSLDPVHLRYIYSPSSPQAVEAFAIAQPYA